ncbi:putative Peptidase A22A [Paratrimastix pyriformis]|uniref:Peptidase A22A n=1 Tax=Paratrimastix pyriformis TaxID=342808 RepID=A0ABQ8UTP8_9EUKA|nr:putative Peptidase A22A [Paratrimastix pyriformis]
MVSEDDLELHAAQLSSLIIPVSITMILVIFVIRSLQISLPSSPSTGQTIVNLSNTDDPIDFWGTYWPIINVLIIVVMVIVATFVFVCLYKHGCTKILWGWLGFATLALLGFFGAQVLLSLLNVYPILPIDYISFAFYVWNYSWVGVICVFWVSPLILQQIYLVAVSVFMAWSLTQMPEWTTWVLLGLVAFYDIFAVFCPCCALNQLIKMAQERDEPIPGLIYTAEVRRTPSNAVTPTRPSSSAAPVVALPAPSAAAAPRPGLRGGCPEPMGRDSEQAPTTGQQQQPVPVPPPYFTVPFPSLRHPTSPHPPEGGAASIPPGGTSPRAASPALSPPPPGVSSAPPVEPRVSTGARMAEVGLPALGSPHERVEDEADHRPSASPPRRAPVDPEVAEVTVPGAAVATDDDEDEEEEDDKGTVRLGLGDFIFFSVLIGRAAMADFTTLVVCFVAILAGLTATVVILAVARRPLPALPLSIFSGIPFYFGARYLVAPLITQLARHGWVLG